MRSAPRITGVVALCILWHSTAASADLITFDPDGAGGANGAVVVGALDMAPGNTLFQFPTNDSYQFSHHAALMGLIDANGTPIATPGLNTLFEITVVSSVLMERIEEGFNVKVVTAQEQPPNSFIEIWYDTTPDANSLAGTGYNDGTRIYFGTPSASLISLATNAISDEDEEPYDQFGANDYPGQMTGTTTGSYLFGSTTNFQDPSFFVSPVASVELTTGIDTPFDMTNPSALFTAMPGGAAPIPGSFITGLPFQADGALNFTVPEPGSAGLLALALPFFGRRNRGHDA